MQTTLRSENSISLRSKNFLQNKNIFLLICASDRLLCPLTLTSHSIAEFKSLETYRHMKKSPFILYNLHTQTFLSIYIYTRGGASLEQIIPAHPAGAYNKPHAIRTTRGAHRRTILPQPALSPRARFRNFTTAVVS